MRPATALAGTALVAVLVAAVVLGLLGTFSQTSRHDTRANLGGPVTAPGTRTATAPPAPRPAAPPTPVPRPSAASATAATAAVAPSGGAARDRLDLALRRILRLAGPDSGVLVEDLSSGDVLFASHPLVARPPASVEKLYTTVALMLRLGPGARLSTELLGAGHRGGAVWHGDLYLRGSGDPTLGDQAFNAFWNHGAGPTPNEIAGRLAAMGIRRVTGRLYADESLFDRRRGGLMTALDADVPDFAGQLSALVYDHGTTLPGYSPATFAVHELALTMRGAHIAVRAAPRAQRAPGHAHVLARLLSPPLAVMVRLMDVPSDDLFAELFTKQLGVRLGRGGTIADGAAVIAGTIGRAYGIHPRILDGSGLARADRSSPLQIVQLLRAVWQTPAGHELTAALPVVARQGTVQGIGVRTPAAGNCVAKTGTLTAVTNLAGYCRSRGGHPLAFALFIDGPSNGEAVMIEDRLIGAIAGYRGR